MIFFLPGKSKSIPTDQAVGGHTAVEFDISNVSWPPNPTGFTVALWMCVDEFQTYGKREGDKKSGNIRSK
jgi:hypothetical protein